MTNLPPDLQADVAAISHIDAVPSILKVLCHTTGMGFAAVARVTEKKWIACAVEDRISFGLVPGGELVVETTICHEIRQNRQAVVFSHASRHDTYKAHHTPLKYGIESYISVPIITKNGEFFGTLCAIDPKPAMLENEATLRMFELYADLIAFHLQVLEEKKLSETRLQEEQRTAELREQFIAILGHDMRNPVAAVHNVAQIMLRMPFEESLQQLAQIIQNSSYRMNGLIDNIMDFAQGRLGNGIVLDRREVNPEETIRQVISELQLIWPQRVLEAQLEISGTVYADGLRLAQLLSNLLGNAITHGSEGQPVRIKACTAGDRFLLSVTNAGPQIPDEARARLFQPFYRGVAPGHKQQGLGLGLYIASEIARAHGGSLEVSSTAAETCFTLNIPVRL